MSKPQHFKTINTESKPYASMLSDQLDRGWEVISIVLIPHGGYTTYFKRVNEPDDPDCTDCEGSGITHQTETYCTCEAGIALKETDHG